MTSTGQHPKAPPETSYPTTSDLLANDLRGTDPKTDPDGGSTSLNALAFSTLLSSQETDAHRCETRVSRPGLITLFCFVHRRGDLIKLPEMIFPVKSAIPIKSGRSSLYAPPGDHYLLASPSGACQAYPPLGVLRYAPAGSVAASGRRRPRLTDPCKHPDRLRAQLRTGAWWRRRARPWRARTPGPGSPRTPRTASPPSPRCRSARRAR